MPELPVVFRLLINFPAHLVAVNRRVAVVRQLQYQIDFQFSLDVISILPVGIFRFVVDEDRLQQIRFTDDVDLIVNVMGISGWYQLRDQLPACGFTEAAGDTVNCRMRLGELKVEDMMIHYRAMTSKTF